MESPFPTFDVTFILSLGFYLLLISYVIFSVILYYHWQSYSVSARVTLQTYFAFFVISLPLLVIMATTLFL
ncbi:MAG: hypothetical protein ACK42D_00385 [Candidatus Paceibacteria bacterium]